MISDIDKETVRQMLHDQLNMTKVSAEMVPQNLSSKNKNKIKNLRNKKIVGDKFALIFLGG